MLSILKKTMISLNNNSGQTLRKTNKSMAKKKTWRISDKNKSCQQPNKQKLKKRPA